MSNPVIKIEDLGKRYTIGRQRSNGDGMRHLIEGALRDPLAWIGSGRRGKLQRIDLWALRDVSLRIDQGEVVGIIGSNGAGKSTLLKILSRITAPTEGRIRINGRIASLLEAGTGFHQELTGRENIFLNGAILGMTRAEIIRKFDEIVDFSGVEEFIDTPVKRYSSGMYVRLGFAVAAHLDPEILVVDEVLSVGDAEFQKKCLGKMDKFAQSGRTVLFVSHNMEAVRALCQRAVWLKGGQLHKDGRAAEIVAEYLNAPNGFSFGHLANPDYGLSIQNVVLKNGHGEQMNQFCPGDELSIQINYDAQKQLERPYFVLEVEGMNGSCFTANMLLDGCQPKVLAGAGTVSCRFKSLPLFPQSYCVKMSVCDKNGTEVIINHQNVAHFNVVGDLTEYGYRGKYLSQISNFTPVVVPYEWSLPDGTVFPISLDHPT
jgi:lipopolysaccharide transport system ATP-binding protein